MDNNNPVIKYDSVTFRDNKEETKELQYRKFLNRHENMTIIDVTVLKDKITLTYSYVHDPVKNIIGFDERIKRIEVALNEATDYKLLGSSVIALFRAFVEAIKELKNELEK